MTALPTALVIVGASGFIGRNLVERFRGRVDRLVGVTATTPVVAGCTHVLVGQDFAALPVLPQDTVVIHVGAYRYDPQRFALAQSDILRHNTELAGRLYHTCADRGIREVRLASSVAVYPAALTTLDDAVTVTWDQPPHAGEACYAWSKRWAETLARVHADMFGIASVVFRLANPYGPFDSIDPGRAHVAPAFVMKALSTAPTFGIRGDAQVTRDFVYVGDVVDAFERSLAWRGRSATFNLCSGTSTSLETFARTAMAVAGVEKPIISGTPGAFGPHARRSTAARLMAALDLTPTPLADGLKPTLDWYRHALAV